MSYSCWTGANNINLPPPTAERRDSSPYVLPDSPHPPMVVDQPQWMWDPDTQIPPEETNYLPEEYPVIFGIDPILPSWDAPIQEDNTVKGETPKFTVKIDDSFDDNEDLQSSLQSTPRRKETKIPRNDDDLFPDLDSEYQSDSDSHKESHTSESTKQ